MPLTSADDYPLYSCEMFGRTETTYALLLATVISGQAALLAERLGALYAPGGVLVIQAEKNLVECELLRLRIIRLVGTVVNGDQADLRPLEKQRNELKAETDGLIAKLLSGVKLDSSGFSSGVALSGEAHNFPTVAR